MKMTERDIKRLSGLHPDLVQIIERAAAMTTMSFTILEGIRLLSRQKHLVAIGASKTMKSRHLTGHAVDIAPLVDTDGDGDIEISWHWPHFHKLAPVVKLAAQQLDIPITWGGDWGSFPDGPHWELPRDKYPA